MKAALLVDGEYANAAAYHWGSSVGINKARLDYEKLIQRVGRAGDVLHSRHVFWIVESDAPPHSKVEVFHRVLRTLGYTIHVQKASDFPERTTRGQAASSLLAAQVVGDVWDEEIKRVYIVSGNGELEPMVKLLVSRGVEAITVGFPGSISGTLRAAATRVIELGEPDLLEAR